MKENPMPFTIVRQDITKMKGLASDLYTANDLTQMEIRNFINEGLRDVENYDLSDFDETFDKIERRYSDGAV